MRSLCGGFGGYRWGMRDDLKWMEYCLVLARRAYEVGEVPVGAVVVRDGELISEALNHREADQTVLGHAEILALKLACEKLGSWRLTGCTLYTSLEPCVMCAGAIIQSRVSDLVYGASDSKGGAQSLFQLFDAPQHNHHVQHHAGVLADESSQLLKKFFSERRKKSNSLSED